MFDSEFNFGSQQSRLPHALDGRRFSLHLILNPAKLSPRRVQHCFQRMRDQVRVRLSQRKRLGLVGHVICSGARVPTSLLRQLDLHPRVILRKSLELPIAHKCAGANAAATVRTVDQRQLLALKYASSTHGVPV
jgi:hypothetical protein